MIINDLPGGVWDLRGKHRPDDNLKCFAPRAWTSCSFLFPLE